MGYVVVMNRGKFGPRKGLEGPFHYPNGQVAYYDPKEGKYWDPLTDWYLSDDEAVALSQQVFDKLSAKKS